LALVIAQVYNRRASSVPETGPTAGRRRRWFLGIEPIFEAGCQGESAHVWDVEDDLVAVAALGDVTIDLSQVRSAPSVIDINAYAVIRDVDVLVGEGTQVEMSGGVYRGDLRNEVPVVGEHQRDRRVVRIHGHSMLGDVTARIAR
jgi:hypothetical protein